MGVMQGRGGGGAAGALVGGQNLVEGQTGAACLPEWKRRGSGCPQQVTRGGPPQGVAVHLPMLPVPRLAAWMPGRLQGCTLSHLSARLTMSSTSPTSKAAGTSQVGTMGGSGVGAAAAVAAALASLAPALCVQKRLAVDVGRAWQL